MPPKKSTTTSLPKAKAKAAVTPGEPAAKAKGKAKAAPAPAAAAPALPKAKAKGKAAPAAAAVEVPPQPKVQAAKSKAKAKPKPAPKPVEVEPDVVVAEKEELVNWFLDDGTGGEWETCTGMTKAAQRKKERKQANDAMVAELKQGLNAHGQVVPGSAPVSQTAAANRAKVSQSVQAEIARICNSTARDATGATTEVVTEGTSNLVSVSMHVPEGKIGIVIGKGGETINKIKAVTKVQNVSTEGGLIVLSGSADAVEQAEAAFKELIEKGFCSLMYEDFAENSVMVHPRNFPDLIGTGGKVVTALKKHLQVEVSFPKTPEGAMEAAKKYKVTLAGSQAQVDRCKTAINNILMYGHDEITHPGLVHEEMEIEDWMFSFIIGRKGSEMRHIQNYYKVKVILPRRGVSMNENVVIVGEAAFVDRAKTYIENVMWKAENAMRGRDREGAGEGDVWGDEDEEEDWMKPYMYKRR